MLNDQLLTWMVSLQRTNASSTNHRLGRNPLVIDANSLLLSKGFRQGAERIRLELTDDVYTVTSQWKDHRIMRTKFTNAVMRGDYAYGLNRVHRVGLRR